VTLGSQRRTRRPVMPASNYRSTPRSLGHAPRTEPRLTGTQDGRPHNARSIVRCARESVSICVICGLRRWAGWGIRENPRSSAFHKPGGRGNEHRVSRIRAGWGSESLEALVATSIIGDVFVMSWRLCAFAFAAMGGWGNEKRETSIEKPKQKRRPRRAARNSLCRLD
jgi:hypothetical protein